MFADQCQSRKLESRHHSVDSVLRFGCFTQRANLSACWKRTSGTRMLTCRNLWLHRKSSLNSVSSEQTWSSFLQWMHICRLLRAIWRPRIDYLSQRQYPLSVRHLGRGMAAKLDLSHHLLVVFSQGANSWFAQGVSIFHLLILLALYTDPKCCLHLLKLLLLRNLKSTQAELQQSSLGSSNCFAC